MYPDHNWQYQVRALLCQCANKSRLEVIIHTCDMLNKGHWLKNDWLKTQMLASLPLSLRHLPDHIQSVIIQASDFIDRYIPPEIPGRWIVSMLFL